MKMISLQMMKIPKKKLNHLKKNKKNRIKLNNKMRNYNKILNRKVVISNHKNYRTNIKI